MEFSSFANYIILSSDIKLVSCYVRMNNTLKIELDMHTPKTNVFSPRKAKVTQFIEVDIIAPFLVYYNKLES